MKETWFIYFFLVDISETVRQKAVNQWIIIQHVYAHREPTAKLDQVL